MKPQTFSSMVLLILVVIPLTLGDLISSFDSKVEYKINIHSGNGIQSSVTNDYTVGSRRTFWVEDTWKAFNNIDDDGDGLVDFADNDYNEGIYSIDTEIVNITANTVFFVDQSLVISLLRSSIHDLADHCSSIATTIEATFAEIPDIDSDSHVLIIITDIRDEAFYAGGSGDLVLGYFWPVHSTFPSSSGIRQYSHTAEIIYLDIQLIASGDISLAAEIISHELQHLVQFHYHPDQDLWLDEGLSVQSEVICGYEKQATQYYHSFSSNPFKSLIYFDRTLAAYGFSSLFVQYLIDQYGDEILSELYKREDIGMVSVINALKKLGHPEITSSELFINFSLALWLQDSNNSDFDFRSITFDLKSPETIQTVLQYLSWTIPSWGFWAKNIHPVGTEKVLHLSFDCLEPVDSLGNPALFYITIVQVDINQVAVIKHWLMDPVTGDNQVLFSFTPNATQVFLLVTAFAGTSGSPLPAFTIPTTNGSLKLSRWDSASSFSFPGYVTYYSTTNEALVTSIHYYSIGALEWTPVNTKIAKWRLLKQTPSGMEATGLTGDLVWSQSGWYVPLLSMDSFVGEFYFRFEFYNGTSTFSFLSECLDLSSKSLTLNDVLPPLVFTVGLISFIGITAIIAKKRRTNPIDTLERVKRNEDESLKFTKLEPLFLHEKKSPKEVRKALFKKHRRK